MTTRQLGPYAAVLLAFSALAGCSSHETMNSEIIEKRLRAGHGEEVNYLSKEVLAGRIKITREILLNVEELPVHIRLEEVSDFEGYTYYLAGSVSQFFLCLLEVRENTSTKSILAEVWPDLVPELASNDLDEESCGVCCGIYPGVTTDIAGALREYWIEKLDL